MARSDILISLVNSGMRQDMVTFARVVGILIVEERKKNHFILADRLTKLLAELREKRQC